MKIDCGELFVPHEHFTVGKQKSRTGALTSKTVQSCGKYTNLNSTQMCRRGVRVCSLCKKDVSWLPRFSACVYCGYKPTQPPIDDLPGHTAKARNIVDYCPNGNKATEDFQISESVRNLDWPLCNKGLLKEGTDVHKVITHLYTLLQSKDENSVAHNRDSCCYELDGSPICKVFGSEFGHMTENNTGEATFASVIKLDKLLSNKRYASLNIKTRQKAPKRDSFANSLKRKVPRNMGWLWTSTSLGQMAGWRPGAIRRRIRELMGYFLKDYPVDSTPVSTYAFNVKFQKPAELGDTNGLTNPPMLKISKRNGEYNVIFRVPKNSDMIRRSISPYFDMKPITFRITKNPSALQFRQLKRSMKELGFSACICHRPITECYCRSFVDKQRVVYTLEKICKKRHIENYEKDLVLSDTTDSDSEFDFTVTPPAGLVKPVHIKSPDTINAESQYNENDWAMKTMIPHMPNAFIQFGGCSIGERKGTFPFIFGKSNPKSEEKSRTRTSPNKHKI